MAILFTGLLLAGCNKDEEQVVPEVEAAQTILTALSPKGAGVVEQMKQACFVTDLTSHLCGQAFDTTVVSERINANFTHNYAIDWNWQVSCTGNVRDSVNLSFLSEGWCENTRLRSTDVSEGEFVITGLPNAVQEFTLEGKIIRRGSQQMKVRKKLAFTSSIEFDVYPVTISKSNLEPSAGLMKVTITGDKGSEGSFSYSGILTLNGGKSATLVLNSGQPYYGNW